MDKVLKVKSRKDDSNDLEYWLSKTHEERLEALEIMRANYISMHYEELKDDIQQGLQRVLRVVKRK